MYDLGHSGTEPTPLLLHNTPLTTASNPRGLLSSAYSSHLTSAISSISTQQLLNDQTMSSLKQTGADPRKDPPVTLQELYFSGGGFFPDSAAVATATSDPSRGAVAAAPKTSLTTTGSSTLPRGKYGSGVPGFPSAYSSAAYAGTGGGMSITTAEALERRLATASGGGGAMAATTLAATSGSRAAYAHGSGGVAYARAGTSQTAARGMYAYATPTTAPAPASASGSSSSTSAGSGGGYHPTAAATTAAALYGGGTGVSGATRGHHMSSIPASLTSLPNPATALSGGGMTEYEAQYRAHYYARQQRLLQMQQAAAQAQAQAQHTALSYATVPASPAFSHQSLYARTVPSSMAATGMTAAASGGTAAGMGMASRSGVSPYTPILGATSASGGAYSSARSAPYDAYFRSAATTSAAVGSTAPGGYSYTYAYPSSTPGYAVYQYAPATSGSVYGVGSETARWYQAQASGGVDPYRSYQRRTHYDGRAHYGGGYGGGSSYGYGGRYAGGGRYGGGGRQWGRSRHTRDGNNNPMAIAKEDPDKPGFRRVPVLGQPPRTNNVNVAAVHDTQGRSIKNLRTYLVRARRLLRLKGTCTICGIGQAVSVAVEVVEQLKRERVAVISEVATDLAQSPMGEIHMRPSLEVTLSCGEWGHLVSDFRRRKVVEVFELHDKSIKGKLSTEELRSLELAKKMYSDESAQQKAEELLAEYSSLNLPQFVEYCSLLIHPLLLEYHFKQAVSDLGGKVDLHDGPLPAVVHRLDDVALVDSGTEEDEDKDSGDADDGGEQKDGDTAEADDSEKKAKKKKKPKKRSEPRWVHVPMNIGRAAAYTRAIIGTPKYRRKIKVTVVSIASDDEKGHDADGENTPVESLKSAE